MPQQFPGGPFQITILDTTFDNTAQATLWFTDDAHCSLVVGTPGQALQIAQQNLSLQLTSTNELQFGFDLQAAAGGYPAGTYTFTIFGVRPQSNQVDGTVTAPGVTNPVPWTATATLPLGPFWVYIDASFPDSSSGIAYLMFSAAGLANYVVGEFGSVNDFSLIQGDLPLGWNLDPKVGLQWNFAFTLDPSDQDKPDGYYQGAYQFTFGNPTLGSAPAGTVSMPDPNGDPTRITTNWTGSPLLSATKPFVMNRPSNDYSDLPITLSFPSNSTANLVVGAVGSPVVNQTDLPISFDDNNAELFFQFKIKGNGSSKTAQNGGWIDGKYTFHFYLPVWTSGGNTQPDPTQLWGILDDPYKDKNPDQDDEPWTAQTNPPTEDETAAVSRTVGQS